MGLINIDNYTIVVDKINYWETEQYNRNFYLTIYLSSYKSIEIKKDTKEEIVKIEKELNRAFGYNMNWGISMEENYTIELPFAIDSYVYKIIKDKRIKHPHRCWVAGYWISADNSCSTISIAHYIGSTFDYSEEIKLADAMKLLFRNEADAEEAMRKLQDED